jgi:hypothetical protein
MNASACEAEARTAVERIAVSIRAVQNYGIRGNHDKPTS